jgi:vibriolysin
LTGGGAFVDWQGAGNLLTASFPNSSSSWEARSKDHDVSDPSRITAYAIGLRPRSASVHLHTIIVNSTGPVQPHPTAQVCLPAATPPWIVSGGGALDNWNGAGNLLTASYPQENCWLAAGKDHKDPSPASITAYAIGIHI